MLESERHKKYEGPERRWHRDPVIKAINLLGAFSWLLVIPVLLLIHQARPQAETFIDRWLGVVLSPVWDVSHFRYAFFLMVAILALSATGLLLNLARNKRRDDALRLHLVIVFCLSLIGAAYYLGRFVMN